MARSPTTLLTSPRECLACWALDGLRREFPTGTQGEPLWRCAACGATLNHVHLSLVVAGADAVMRAVRAEVLPPDRFRTLQRFLWNLFADLDREWQRLPEEP